MEKLVTQETFFVILVSEVSEKKQTVIQIKRAQL
jgi:hypothetical protein